MTPQDHRDYAAQLLDDAVAEAESPSQARVLTQAAIAHALLGLLEIAINRPEHRTVINNSHVTTERTAAYGN